MSEFCYAGQVMPETIRAALDRYATLHQPAGHFVMACLRNDFMDAAASADDDNAAKLAVIACYMRWEIPAACWGSEEKVDAWLAQAPARSIEEAA